MDSNNGKIPVVIMAGGLGKRAAEIDSTIPKPLIPIVGKPILQWEIERLVHQGYNDIILTVSHMAEKIVEFFGDGSRFDANISYYREIEPLGNAGALFKLVEEERLEGEFLLLNADSMFDIDFNRFVSFHREHSALATLFVHPNNHPYDSGLIICDSNAVVRQWLTKEDKRPEWYKNCVNAGLHIINTELLRLSGIEPKEVGTEVGQHKVDLDRDILKPLVSTGKIFAYNSPEYVKDMGTPERFGQVKEDLVSGKVETRNLKNKQKAVFLDRDGVINKYAGFLRDIADFELLPGVAEAIKCINDSGYLCIVVSNQPVIARGEVSVEELDMIHNKMETLLGEEGAYLDAIYYCPHHPDKGFDGEIPELKIDCDCRKPKPGMLLKAAEQFNIDLSQSWMIGDSWRDIKAGSSAGCKTVYIKGDKEKKYEETFIERGISPSLVADDLFNATSFILGKDNNEIANNINHLFIIGNGFDIEHKYPTEYKNFRNYLIKHFSVSGEYDDLVPSSIELPDGGKEYDMSDTAEFIVNILDKCSGEDWSDLESSLGDDSIDCLAEDLFNVDIEQSDNDMWHVVFNNEDLSMDMKESFVKVIGLFRKWVVEYYDGFKYGLNKSFIKGDNEKSIDCKGYILDVLESGDGFLSFNYTLTLEKVYGLDSKQICHIHGKIGDDMDNLLFGHGEKNDIEESFATLGAEANLNELKDLLRKDTEGAYLRNTDFFNRIGSELKDIHSFGYSFSDVDMYYVERIAERVVPSKITWYINKHDSDLIKGGSVKGKKLDNQIRKVKELGFVVKTDDRW